MLAELVANCRGSARRRIPKCLDLLRMENGMWLRTELVLLKQTLGG